jgi:glutaredoxin-like protein NrdH
MASHVILYTAPRCSDCDKLKAYLDRHAIPCELRDIKANPDYAAELAEHTGKQGVPYLVIDGEWRRGYEPGQPYSDEFARRLIDGG